MHWVSVKSQYTNVHCIIAPWNKINFESKSMGRGGMWTCRADKQIIDNNVIVIKYIVVMGTDLEINERGHGIECQRYINYGAREQQTRWGQKQTLDKEQLLMKYNWHSKHVCHTGKIIHEAKLNKTGSNRPI